MRTSARVPLSPRPLPARAGGSFLATVGRHVMADQLPLLTAGVAFFAVLSIAPVLVTALWAYTSVNTPEQALQQLSGVARLLPVQVEPVAAEQLTTITAASTHVLTRQGLASLLFALWTATTATTYLLDALTLAYQETETRGLLRRSALALVFVLSGALLLGGVIAGSGVTARWLAHGPPALRAAAPVLAWVAAAALMVAVLDVLYRFGPDRPGARWSWISWGATSATGLWLLMSLGLFAYVQRLGTYESTYGSLAGVAISMFWLWLSVFLVIVGAAVNGEVQRRRSLGTGAVETASVVRGA